MSDDVAETSHSVETAIINVPKTRATKRLKNAKKSKKATLDPHEVNGRTTESSNILPSPRGEEDTEDTTTLQYGASHVIQLFVPVSICMAFVIITMSTIGFYTRKDNIYLLYTPFNAPTDSTTELVLFSIGNALIMLVLVIVMTGVLILLYYYKFYKVIHGWLILSSLFLLSIFTIIYISEILKNYNIPLDYITLSFLIWNYGVLGIICIHWKGPLILQQIYLMIISILMALILLKYMPDWTVWAVLAMLSVWDLIAVLSPAGPLKMLVEISQERNEPIFPALIYSSTVLYFYMFMALPKESLNHTPTNEFPEESEPTSSTPPPTSSSTARYAPLRNKKTNSEIETPAEIVSTQENSATVRRLIPSSDSSSRSRAQPIHQPNETQTIIEQGVKLGLGDFIFYSVLVGKASTFGDWNTTLACYIAILVGLAITLVLLALFRKALPALPISIFGGLIFCFTTQNFITPFTSELSIRQYLL